MSTAILSGWAWADLCAHRFFVSSCLIPLDFTSKCRIGNRAYPPTVGGLSAPPLWTCTAGRCAARVTERDARISAGLAGRAAVFAAAPRRRRRGGQTDDDRRPRGYGHGCPCGRTCRDQHWRGCPRGRAACLQDCWGVQLNARTGRCLGGRERFGGGERFRRAGLGRPGRLELGGRRGPHGTATHQQDHEDGDHDPLQGDDPLHGVYSRFRLAQNACSNARFAWLDSIRWRALKDTASKIALRSSLPRLGHNSCSRFRCLSISRCFFYQADNIGPPFLRYPWPE